MCMADSSTGLWYGFPSNSLRENENGGPKRSWGRHFCFAWLEGDFDCELNLPRRCAGLGQDPCRGQCPCPIEDIRVVRGDRRSEVGMVENVEKFCAELKVKILRDSLNVIIFEHGEVHLRCARGDQDIAPSIAPKVEAGQGWKITDAGVPDGYA